MTREEILLVAKPILFNTDMVMAILDGKKSETRRIMKPQPLFKTNRKFIFDDDTCPIKWEDCDDIIKTYRYQPGYYLYVRETWSTWTDGYVYKAWISPFPQPGRYPDEFMTWHPSIHMPKEAARIFLRVTDVRVERLQDMTSDDAEKEGCSEYLTESKFRVSPLGHFMEIWDSTITKKDLGKYGWAANPWVWVIQFERVEV